MRIDEVVVRTLVVPFREPLMSGTERWDQRRIGLLSLRTDNGLVGLGEYVSPEPDDLGEESSERLVASLSGLDLGDPVGLERTLRGMDRWPFVGRVARAAAESAIVDLRARASGLSIAASLGAGSAPDVAVNALLGIAAPDAAAAGARHRLEAGYRTLKLKAGAEPPGTIEDRVAAVRDAAGPEAALRVDFNGTLDRSTATGILARLAAYDLEYVEQPIPASAGPAALASLRARTPVPLAADESVRDLGSARALLGAKAVDALVLKPARVGGLRQAHSIIELAAQAGVPVTLSTLFESGVGIAGALHLAAIVPGAHAHGLGTGELLASDLLRTPLAVTRGRLAVPAGPGLGVELDEAALRRFAAP